jgi:hypothetical protein
MSTQKQFVHDWSTGSLRVYEIDAETIVATEPPTAEPEKELPA